MPVPPITASPTAGGVASSDASSDSSERHNPSASTPRPDNETPLVHMTGRNIGLSKKLLANFVGAAATTIPAATVGLLVNVIAAVVRENKLSDAMVPAAISAALQSGTAFVGGALITGASHYSGTDRHLYDQRAPEKEELQERALISGLLAGASSTLISLGFNIAGNAVAGRDITGKTVVDAVVEEVATTLAARGVISAGAAAIWKYDQSFRQLVERTVMSVTTRAGDAGQDGIVAALELATRSIEGPAASEASGQT